jgi:hypothetical protein
MTAKIKLEINEHSEFVDISGSHIELVFKLSMLFARQKELKKLIETSLAASDILGESEILRDFMTRHSKERKPKDSSKDEAADKEQVKEGPTEDKN